MPDALQMLRDDHKKVQDMFKKFESSSSSQEKGRIAKEAMKELKIHSLLEEEIFYPAVRREDPDLDETMNEADEEHHVVDLLMEELQGLSPSNSHFEAKFTVLAENVKHHIREEESEILPKAAEAGREMMNRLGEQMEERKAELMQEIDRLMRGGTRGRAASRNGTGGRTTRTGSTRGRTTTGRKSTSRRSRTTGRTTTGRTSTRSRASSTSREGTPGRTSRSRTMAGARSTSRSTGTRASTTRSRSGGTRTSRTRSEGRKTTSRSRSR